MLHKYIYFIVFLALFCLTGCDEERPLLNSERIQQRFGSYGVDIVHSGQGIRVSNLYSEDADLRTCRTFAIVEFVEPVDPRIDAVHDTILAGGSLGSSLRDAGWEVRKRLTYIGEMPLTDPQSELARLMHVSVPRHLAIHAYDLSVWRRGDSIDYASIVEIHHPEYLDVRQLRAIYGRRPGETPPLRLPGDPAADPLRL